MKKHDLVRVWSQPSNQCVKLVGAMAIVLEVYDNYVDIAEIGEGGMIKGSGTVPMNCLKIVPAPNPKWQTAYNFALAKL